MIYPLIAWWFSSSLCERCQRVGLYYPMIPLSWSSIKCTCFTSIKCCSGTHLERTCLAVYKMPLQSPLFYHFIESFLPSIKDDREVQDVADGWCIYRREFLQNVTVIYGPCCERKVHFIEGSWGQSWSLRCFQSIYWLEWNGHFIEALLSWYSVRRWLFEGCTWCTVILATVGSESNTRVRLANLYYIPLGQPSKIPGLVPTGYSQLRI